MKTVYFIRHAKSSWEDMSLRDKDRPLNKRGKRDAPFMAQLLKGKGVQVDKIISSPANRAYTTATYFAKELNIPENDILVKEQIYEAYTEDVLNIINKLDAKLDTVLIFGHNPTFTSLANLYSKKYIANVPTCGIVEVSSTTEDWNAFNNENSVVKNIYFPKQYF